MYDARIAVAHLLPLKLQTTDLGNNLNFIFQSNPLQSYWSVTKTQQLSQMSSIRNLNTRIHYSLQNFTLKIHRKQRDRNNSRTSIAMG